MSEPPLSLEMFRAAAREILQEIANSRKMRDQDYAQWARLWSLLRLMKTGHRIYLRDQGPWSTKTPQTGRLDLQSWLIGDNVWLAIRLPSEIQPGDLQLSTDLPKILNGARVEPPDD